MIMPVCKTTISVCVAAALRILFQSDDLINDFDRVYLGKSIPEYFPGISRFL